VRYGHKDCAPDQVLEDKQVTEFLKNEINKLLRPKRGFKPHERLQSIHFLSREFSLGEELTNTLKKKRHVIEQKYQNVINGLLR
jgi:long-chain acyl-CoA synthetase